MNASINPYLILFLVLFYGTVITLYVMKLKILKCLFFIARLGLLVLLSPAILFCYVVGWLDGVASRLWDGMDALAYRVTTWQRSVLVRVSKS